MPEYFDQYCHLVPWKKYHPGNALSLAIASNLAYQNKALVETTALAWGFQDVKFLEVKKGADIDTQCFVAGDKKNILIAFRGSDNIKDWFANFQAVREPGPLQQTKAHEGFQDALYPAVMKLTEILTALDSAKKKIWLTGHSLGGALCSLFAGMLIENDYEVYGIYTYGSPRPGNESFASQLNEKIKGPHYRIVNTGDIVPHVPPEPFFSHPGNRIILKEHKRIRTKSSWFSERILALKEFVEQTGKQLDVGNNHRLSANAESYIPRLIQDVTTN